MENKMLIFLEQQQLWEMHRDLPPRMASSNKGPMFPPFRSAVSTTIQSLLLFA